MFIIPNICRIAQCFFRANCADFICKGECCPLNTCKRLACLLFVFAALLTPACAVEPPVINAKAAILYELTNDTVLFEQNADEKLYPASTTKLMTAIVASENGNLDDMVTVSPEAVDGLYERGSSVFLIPGEQMAFSDMLRYLLVASGNDAANALAEHVAGSVDAFVEMMNARAAELGCTGTHFANPHGLHDENHYTTARDLLRIARCAMQNPLIAEIVSMQQITIAPTNKHPNETRLTTTNHLISRIRRGDYYYESAIGIKTGFTTPAGYCLVAGAQNGDLTYFSVVLGASEGEDGSLGSFTETIKLLDYAKEGFSVQPLTQGQDPVTEVPVRLASDRDSLVLVPEGSLSALLPSDFDPSLVQVDFTTKQDICAPISKGQVLGEAVFSYNGKAYGTLNLVANDDIERSTVLYVVDRITSFFGGTVFRVIVGALLALAVILVIWLFIMRSRNRRRRRRSSRRGGRYRM